MSAFSVLGHLSGFYPTVSSNTDSHICFCLFVCLIVIHSSIISGFPNGSVGMESSCNAGDPTFDPCVGKIPWRMAW